MNNLKLLKKTIYKTIEDIEIWQDVLRLLSESTGAAKGIITLRDRLSAEIIIPEVVRYDLGSPLLYGFSEKEVSSFIEHYIEFDPWTEFEKLYHPTLPYPLSKYVNLKDIKTSPFWEWLKPQGISDTIVVDIGTFSKTWVAMNLYFPAEDDLIKQRILNYTVELQSDMQNAWRYGQRYRASGLNPKYLKFFLEQQPEAAFLIEPDSSLILANDKATALFNENMGLFIDAKNYFRIKNPVFRNLFENEKNALDENRNQSASITPSESVVSGNEFSLAVTLIETIQDKIGAYTGMFLIKILTSSVTKELSHKQPIWDNPILTKRERQLVELLANGYRVADFIKFHGIKKVTGHFHWGNVKKKLNVKDRSEIYAKHQVFIRNL